jgi:hypothetical protein
LISSHFEPYDDLFSFFAWLFAFFA